MRFQILLCLLCLTKSFGAGFYLSEIGTPGSLGTAGVANPVNTVHADSSYTNPAGMTGLKEDQFEYGTTLFLPLIEFDSKLALKGGGDGGNAGNIAPVPSMFYVRKLSDKFRLGISVTAPIGGGIVFGDNFVGHYSTSKVLLSGVAVSPSLGYKVNDRLSIGAGVSLVYTSFGAGVSGESGTLARWENII
jgi:long-chain fatty acid transport protein